MENCLLLQFSMRSTFIISCSNAVVLLVKPSYMNHASLHIRHTAPPDYKVILLSLENYISKIA